MLKLKKISQGPALAKGSTTCSTGVNSNGLGGSCTNGTSTTTAGVNPINQSAGATYTCVC